MCTVRALGVIHSYQLSVISDSGPSRGRYSPSQDIASASLPKLTVEPLTADR
jgi:hypothetical protein